MEETSQASESKEDQSLTVCQNSDESAFATRAEAPGLQGHGGLALAFATLLPVGAPHQHAVDVDVGAFP